METENFKSEDTIIGRPPIFVDKNGKEIYLPVHDAFAQEQAKRQILVMHRRGRKTSLSLEKVFKYLITNPKIVGKTLLPKLKQAKEIVWDDPNMLFHENICPPGIIANINKSQHKITLKNGSIYYLDGADNPDSQRGGNVQVLHLPEAGDHKEAIWSQIYEPVLMANGGVAIFEGNPRGRNWYHRLYHQAQGREGWATFLLSARNSPIFTPEQLRDLEMNNPWAVFAAEYLCEWIDSIGTVFRTFRNVANAKESPAEYGKKYRIGVDLAKMLDYTFVSVVDRHTWHQVKVDRWNQVDWTIQKERLKAIIKQYALKANGNAVEVIIEGNGVGSPIFDDLYNWSATEPTLDIMMRNYITNNAGKNLLVQNFSMLCDQGAIGILPYEPLMQELELFTYEKTATSFVYGAPDGYHDDTVMGTMLSYWELGTKLQPPEQPDLRRTSFGQPIDKQASSFVIPNIYRGI